MRNYRRTHKSRIRELQRQWWLRNRDELKEKMRLYNKEYYRRNKERIMEKRIERIAREVRNEVVRTPF